MRALVPCPSCGRHRRVCESLCPFCGTPILACETSTASATARGRLSRAMLIAGAALLGTSGACENLAPPYGTPPPAPRQDASVDSGAGSVAPSPGGAKDGGRDS
jgi:hypothetical protein